MPYNPKSLLNLKGRGRKKKALTALKNIPKEAQAEIYQALWTALTHDNFQEAKKYLESVNIPNYGFIIQIVLRELADKKTSWRCVNDILDRLFGKAQIMITSDKDVPIFKIEFVKNEEEDNDNENDEG